jgi:serine O-acetyltransferase
VSLEADALSRELTAADAALAGGAVAAGDRPSRGEITRVLAELRAALFPRELGVAADGEAAVAEHLAAALAGLREQVRRCAVLFAAERPGEGITPDQAEQVVAAFAAKLPTIRTFIEGDIAAAFSGDPAARSRSEILHGYPGVRAMIDHRLAHLLYTLEVPLLPRIASEAAHSATGIDIHPGATIGERFFIDHGTGVVIGETAIIGNGVRLYQGVTLGSKSFPKGDDGTLVKGQPRHPIIEDNVVIYSGATVLGRITVGQDSTIGGNVWLTKSVPAGSQVSQAKARNDDLASEGSGI